MSEYDNGGTTNLRCSECPNGYYSTAETELVYNCTVCAAEGQIAGANGVCACVAPEELQSSFCVDATDFAAVVTVNYTISSGTEVRYTDVISATTNTGTGRVTASNTFEYLLPQALYECLKWKYYKQCQILANLCVLQMYYEASPPCEALINLANTTTAQQNEFYSDDGWKTGLPWIYYQNTATDVLNNRNRIQAKMTLSTKEADSARYAYIPFKLAKYSLEGDFLGWEDLSNQIWMCPVTVEGSKRYRRVGLGLAKE